MVRERRDVSAKIFQQVQVLGFFVLLKLFETNEKENQTGVNMFIERSREKFELEHTL